MNAKEQEEYQVIVVNPKRCTDCESCMTICSFVHGTPFTSLKERIIGTRVRIELEWAISCDLCKGMKEEYVASETGRTSQCITACPHEAIFISSIEALEGDSRMEAIRRVFNEKA